MNGRKNDKKQQDDVINQEVALGLGEASEFVKTLNADDVKSGQWFYSLLKKVMQSYDRNARAEYFQKKYPGLDPDDIADTLISVVTRYAAIAGGVTGGMVTADQISVLATAGMTVALMAGAVGAEMAYLSTIQLRLILDLSVIYDLHLDIDDPEDALMVFGYALGVAPMEATGKLVSKAAGAGTKYAIKKYLSKGTLKTVQDFARKIGFNLLQKTVIKYAVPFASIAVGSSYNYVATRSLGLIAKSHLKNRGKVTDELRSLVSRQNTYDLVFPAAALYLMQVDGQISEKEKEIYRAMLSRMSFDEHSQDELQKIMANEENILNAIAEIDDKEMCEKLVDVLVLIAVYDGELAEEERDFLSKVAERLDVSLDVDATKEKAAEYQVIVEKNTFQKMIASTKSATSDSKTKAVAVLRNMRRKKEVSKVRICSSCQSEVSSEYNFCPDCGQAMATDKECVVCNKIFSVDYAFCPYCGAQQE